MNSDNHQQTPTFNRNFLNNIPEPMFEDDCFIVPVNCSVNNFLPIYSSNNDILNWNPSIDLTRITLTVKVINDYLDFSKIFHFEPLLSNQELFSVVGRLIQSEEDIEIQTIKLNNTHNLENNDSHINYNNGDVLFVYINNIININLRERTRPSNNQEIIENFSNNLNNLVDYLNTLIDANDINNQFPLDEEIRNETMTLEQINNIESHTFEDVNHVNNYSDTCTICQEKFKENDTVSLLPCNHVFHKDCLKNWLLNYNCVCPICRGRIETV